MQTETQQTEAATKGASKGTGKGAGKKAQPVVPAMSKEDNDYLPFSESVTPKPEQPVTEPEVLSEQELIVNETNKFVAKLDLNLVKINEWATQYKGLVVTSLTDKEGLKAVKEGKAVIRKARTTVESKRKDAKSFYLEVGRSIDAKAKEYTSLLEDIETPLDTQLEKFKQWEEEEAKRKEEEAQRVINNRISTLKDAGMSFNGSYYVCGDTMSMDINTIATMNDDDFTSLVAKVTDVKAQIDAEAARVEAEKQAKSERQAEERRKFEQEQKELQAERDRMQKEREYMENEKKAMQAARVQVREQSLYAAGMIYDAMSASYVFKNKYTYQSIAKSELESSDAAAWNDKSEQVISLINIAKKNAYAEARKEEQYQATIKLRGERIAAIGLVVSDSGFRYKGSDIFISSDELANMVDAGFESEMTRMQSQIKAYDIEQARLQKEEDERRAKEIADRLEADRIAKEKADAERESKRVAMLSDTEKVRLFIGQIEAIAPPEVAAADTQRLLDAYTQIMTTAGEKLLRELSQIAQ